MATACSESFRRSLNPYILPRRRGGLARGRCRLLTAASRFLSPRHLFHFSIFPLVKNSLDIAASDLAEILEDFCSELIVYGAAGVELTRMPCALDDALTAPDAVAGHYLDAGTLSATIAADDLPDGITLAMGTRVGIVPRAGKAVELYTVADITRRADDCAAVLTLQPPARGR